MWFLLRNRAATDERVSMIPGSDRIGHFRSARRKRIARVPGSRNASCKNKNPSTARTLVTPKEVRLRFGNGHEIFWCSEKSVSFRDH